MDSDKKLAMVVFLTVVGVIWLFFCVIWMPPIWLRVSTDKLPYSILRYEYIFPLCLITLGLYIALRRYLELHPRMNHL
jgi:hypothetical protein